MAIQKPPAEGLDTTVPSSADRAPTLIDDLNSVCIEIFRRWDADMRSGKLLLALEGAMQNYDPRITRVREALNMVDAIKEARAARSKAEGK